MCKFILEVNPKIHTKHSSYDTISLPEMSNLAFCRDWKRAPLGGRSGKCDSSRTAYLLSLGVTFSASGAMFTQSMIMVPTVTPKQE